MKKHNKMKSTVLLALCLSFFQRVLSLTILIVCEEGSRSHVVPYFEVSRLLQERGHKILFASLEENLKFASDHSFVNAISIGNKTVSFEKSPEIMAKMMSTPAGYKAMAPRFVELSNMILQNYPERVQTFANLFEEIQPDLVLCDFFAQACFDSAYMNGVNLGILGAVGFQGFQSEWFIPSIMNPVPQNTWMGNMWLRISTTADMLWHVGRVFVPLELRVQKFKKTVWKERTVPNTIELFSQKLVLSHTLFGFAPAQKLPPNVLALGPLLAPYRFNHTGNEQLVDLLDSLVVSQSRLVYIAFGSAAAGFEGIAKRLFDGINTILANNSDVHVLWACRDAYCLSVVTDHVEGKFQNRVHVHKWVAQRAVLEHSVTKAFVSHGGISSLHESIFGGVPLVVVPLFGDQHLNAVYVEERRIGINLKDKLGFTGNQVATALSVILNAKRGSNQTETEFSLEPLEKLKGIARLNAQSSLLVGANAIEAVARFGVGHLVPADIGFSIWSSLRVTNHLQLWSVVVSIAAGFLYLFPLWIGGGRQKQR
ncbi:hypothetical protein BDR26DRAFT_921934 [Obelidium mucronatum]|nr:hypothetical protein BDR26DRAFT_921934 [Obelidium mucronatum]